MSSWLDDVQHNDHDLSELEEYLISSCQSYCSERDLKSLFIALNILDHSKSTHKFRLDSNISQNGANGNNLSRMLNKACVSGCKILKNAEQLPIEIDKIARSK